MLPVSQALEAEVLILSAAERHHPSRFSTMRMLSNAVQMDKLKISARHADFFHQCIVYKTFYKI